MGFVRAVASFIAIVLAATLAAGASGIIHDPLAIPPGTRGYCLTEMPGGAIEKIPVTIVGPQGPVTPGGEMVLIRLDDPRFAKTGIIAGMSGSPVYVDGKLLGALAFGWAFEREPIGGVTPFVRMLGLENGSAAPQRGAPRPALATIVQNLREGTLAKFVLTWLAPPHAPGGHALPLSATLGPGRSPAAMEWLGPLMRRAGLEISGGARRRAAPAAARPLVPGAMVAIVLVDGDATVAAAGTVTEVRDGRVWAFGHPFLKAGSVRLPLARANVVGVLPNLNSSFKFFTVGPMIGEITADRARGIFGTLGAAAPMVPVTVEANGTAYRFRIVPNPALAPLLVAYIVQASQAAHGRGFGEQTLRMKMDLSFAGGAVVRLAESFARANAPAQAAALAAALVGYVEGSPFRPPAIDTIRVSLDSVEKVAAASLIEAVPQRTVVHPGEQVRVWTRWRIHHGGEIDHSFSLGVPRSMPPGPLDLIVADGGAWSTYDLKVRPSRPASFGDELRLLGRLVPASSAVVALERKDTGIVMRGGTISAPPSFVLSLRAGLDGGVQTAGSRIVATTRADLGMPLSGAVRLHLVVRENAHDHAAPSKLREVR
ncbi:MAG: hypothetical protein GXP48_09120 [Acidobacteria bacterium]|nr:hypothetical protein [Acidobacteriota bacterium]